MDGLRAYRSLLENRPLAKLLLGEFISGIGDWLYIVAIFIVIYRESNDAALVGLFGAVRMIPYVIMSVPAGIVADRFDRRLVLLASDLWRGSMMVGMTLLLAANASVIWVAGLAILATIGSSFFYPAIGAYIPSLAKDERQLGPANSAWASLGNISFILGPAIGGVIVAAGDVLLAFVINAVTFVVIAAILWTLPPSRPRRADAAAPADGPEATGSTAPERSIRTALALRPLTGLTMTQLLAGFLGGGLQASTIILAVYVLNAGEAANGYLNAAVGIGGLLGGLGSGAFVMRRVLGIPLIAGTLITGAATVVLGMAGNGGLGLALVAIGVASAGFIVVDVVTTTMFQRLVPDEFRGRVLGVLMALTTAFGAAGALLVPIMIQGTGDFPGLGSFDAFLFCGVGLVIVTGLGTILIGRAADRAPSVHEALIARVAALPLFAGVPKSRLHAAMDAFHEMPVTAGQVVIAQGDPADHFYVIATGEFSVTQVSGAGEDVGAGTSEPRLLRRLGPDEVFGELGLLNNNPRSATVTADSDGLLLALDDKDFLQLVGAEGPLRGRLTGLYGGPRGR
jgi:MFS family permease